MKNILSRSILGMYESDSLNENLAQFKGYTKSLIKTLERAFLFYR